MKRRFTLVPLRKKLSNRSGISGILEAMMLIGIVTVGGGIVLVGISQMNLESLSCEIQLFEVYEISDDNYWVEMILYNNGDYTFDGTLKYFDEITITDLSHDSLNEINPNDKVNLEFSFTGNMRDEITMGFDIISNEQNAFCIKKVTL